MDLLFKRYANPFLLVDEMIANGELYNFVNKFVEKVNKEDAYDVWLHRVFDKPFNEFYEKVLSLAERHEVNVEEAIETSNEVLNIIQPKEGE